MEVAIFDILKRLASPDSSSLEFFAIIAVLIFLMFYKYLVKPFLEHVKTFNETLAKQNTNISSMNTSLERLESNIIALKESSEINYSVNKVKIDESQRDINEMKSILSQFQGAMMYNARLFNRELE